MLTRLFSFFLFPTLALAQAQNYCMLASADMRSNPQLRELLVEQPKIMKQIEDDLLSESLHSLLMEETSVLGFSDEPKKRELLRCILESDKGGGENCPRGSISGAAFEPPGGYFFRATPYGEVPRYLDLISLRNFTNTYYTTGADLKEVPDHWEPYDVTSEWSIYRAEEAALLGVQALRMSAQISTAEEQERLTKTIATKVLFATAFAAATHGLGLSIMGPTPEELAAAKGNLAEAIRESMAEKIWDRFNNSIMLYIRIEGQNRAIRVVAPDEDSASGSPSSVLSDQETSLMDNLFNLSVHMEKLRASKLPANRATMEEVRDFYDRFQQSLTDLKSLTTTVPAYADVLRVQEPNVKLAPFINGVQGSVSFSEQHKETQTDFNLSSFVPRMIEFERLEKARCEADARKVLRRIRPESETWIPFKGEKRSTELEVSKALVELIELEEACLLRRMTIRLAKFDLFARTHTMLNQFCRAVNQN